MALTEKQKGELYILGSTFIGALFPIITVLSYRSLPSLISLIGSVFFAGIFFAFVMTFQGLWPQLKNKQVWKYVFYITITNGVIYYSLVFIGLTKTTPGNVSIIGVFEVFTSFLFFNLF
jgi:drug/metabolite transporter (DMT)-like permease